MKEKSSGLRVLDEPLLVTATASVDNELDLIEREETHLHLACKKKCLEEVVRILHQDTGARDVLNYQNSLGETALFLAVKSKSKELVELLLQHGADPNVQKFTDEAPIHRACLLGLEDIVRALLDSGADPTLIFKGQTAKEVAEMMGDYCIAIILENHPLEISIKKNEPMKLHRSGSFLTCHQCSEDIKEPLQCVECELFFCWSCGEERSEGVFRCDSCGFNSRDTASRLRIGVQTAVSLDWNLIRENFLHSLNHGEDFCSISIDGNPVSSTTLVNLLDPSLLLREDICICEKFCVGDPEVGSTLSRAYRSFTNIALFQNVLVLSDPPSSDLSVPDGSHLDILPLRNCKLDTISLINGNYLDRFSVAFGDFGFQLIHSQTDSEVLYKIRFDSSSQFHDWSSALLSQIEASKHGEFLSFGKISDDESVLSSKKNLHELHIASSIASPHSTPRKPITASHPDSTSLLNNSDPFVPLNLTAFAQRFEQDSKGKNTRTHTELLRICLSEDHVKIFSASSSSLLDYLLLDDCIFSAHPDPLIPGFSLRFESRLSPRRRGYFFHCDTLSAVSSWSSGFSRSRDYFLRQQWSTEFLAAVSISSKPGTPFRDCRVLLGAGHLLCIDMLEDPGCPLLVPLDLCSVQNVDWEPCRLRVNLVVEGSSLILQFKRPESSREMLGALTERIRISKSLLAASLL